MTRLKADEIVSKMLSKHEVDPVPELKIEDPKVMKDVDIAGGEGDAGKSGSMAAKEIIRDRVQGFDFNLYEWNKKMSQRRSEGVKDFWNQEREGIIKGERTTKKLDSRTDR